MCVVSRTHSCLQCEAVVAAVGLGLLPRRRRPCRWWWLRALLAALAAVRAATTAVSTECRTTSRLEPREWTRYRVLGVSLQCACYFNCLTDPSKS